MSETRTDSLSLAEQADAEAAEAEAQAAAARLRAQQLRERRTEAAAEAAEAAEAEDIAVETEDHPAPRRRNGGAVWRGVAESVLGIAVLALIAAAAFLVYQDRQMQPYHQQQDAYAEAARQGVINLMSLDFNNAQADIQRVIDSTTGEFHDDFASSTGDFLTVMKESQVVTTATVNAVGVETMTDDSAVVLVAATSQVANSVSKQPNPRIWRLSVTVNRVDGQIKMSKVEFVP